MIMYALYSKKLILYASLLLSAIACSDKKEYTNYVNPFIGTDKTHFVSQWRSEGSTYPGAVAPHGMVQLSPETSDKDNFLQGYYYWHDTIRAFSLTEHFSGWPNGSVGRGKIMPFRYKTTSVAHDPDKIKSSFNHKSEWAQPGFYAVYLQDSKIKCSFTALTRSVLGELIFEGPGKPGLVISDYEHIKVISANELLLQLRADRSTSFAPNQYVFIHFVFKKDIDIQLNDDYGIVYFQKVSEKEPVRLKYGASYVSAKNAQENLQHEIPDWNFDRVKNQSTWLWNKELRRIEVDKGEHRKKEIFYTAMYHSLLLPVNATDVNGQYPGYEDDKPLRPGETHYIYFTPWDSFRTLHPLINFIDPEKGRDFIRSILRFYRSYGRLPELEVMTGMHMSSLILDALSRGITDFDVKLAYQGLSELMLEEPYFRDEMKEYINLGYVPYPELYATTSTLEFAYNDWCMSQIAKYRGKEKVYDSLIQRSFNYRNNYHPDKRFMLSRNRDGSWADVSLYAEADKWNMSWFVPHNTRDLINLMGGDEAFCNHLNRNFDQGHYVLDNECPMSFSYLFSYAGQPWKTMYWTNKITNEYFNNTPGGIPGNDDWGTMSSWYVWAAMGLYPSCPGTDELIISTPEFDKITIHPGNKKKIVIKSKRRTSEDIYINNCRLKNNVYQKPYITQDDLQEKRFVRLVLDDKPNKEWGIQAAYQPFSVTIDVPRFHIKSMHCDQSIILSGALLSISINIENKGATGSFNLTLMDRGKTIYSRWVKMNKNEIKDLKVPLTLYQPGVHRISLQNESIIVMVKPSESDKPVITYDKPDVKPLIHSSEYIRFTCEMHNLSAYESELQLALYINDKQVKEIKNIRLAPGEIFEITDSIPACDYSGINNLQINNSESTSFKVYKKNNETLVLHYTFDNDNEKVLDYSGFNNHGSIIGDVKYTNGISGKGVKFIDGYIKIPLSKSLDITGKNISMLCWYKPNDDIHRSCLITKGARNMLKMNGKWQIRLSVGGWGLGECLYNAPPKPGCAAEPVWNNQWSHFAGIGKPGRTEIYYNGNLGNWQPHEGEMKHNKFEWRIGSSAEVPDSYSPAKPEGVIDEVMIFAGSLSIEEINNIIKKVQ